MKTDYHIHTLFSDGRKDLREYVDQAVKREIDEIGFSDHVHFKKAVWSMNFSELPQYVNEINKLKETSSIPLKVGLEVDFVPSRMDELMKTIRKFNVDYLIGSVHFIDDWLIDTEAELHKWKDRDVDLVYQQYFTLVQSMARSGLFDVVGHIDLVKKFNFRPKKDISSLLNETVEIVSKTNMCVEVNTSGLRKPCKELYPSERFLELCFDNGVQITLGSDAHSPEEVGADFDNAIGLLKRIGYRELVRFTRRKRETADL